jgi:hypothetical protein
MENELNKEIENMEHELNKELVRKLLAVKGEVRGVAFTTDTQYLLEQKGEEGLRAVEEELARLGYPFKYKEIKTMNFYPVGMRAISVLAIKKVFNLNDQQLREMGFLAAKKSFFIRILTKYFVSLKKIVFEYGPRIWRKQFTVGELTPVEVNEEMKYAIVRIKGLDLHPDYCTYLAGYIAGVANLSVKTSEMDTQETKCPFKGDEYHEYLVKWK